MPTYELCLVLRCLPRPALVDAAKRAAGKVLEAGGVIRSMESLGERQLPQLQRGQDETFSRGVYFNLTCDLPVSSLAPLIDEFRRDSDLLRKAFVGVDTYRNRPEPTCTLQEELLPPPHRPSVQKMIKDGRKQHPFKREWQALTGMDYYPFKR